MIERKQIIVCRRCGHVCYTSPILINPQLVGIGDYVRFFNNFGDKKGCSACKFLDTCDVCSRKKKCSLYIKMTNGLVSAMNKTTDDCPKIDNEER